MAKRAAGQQLQVELNSDDDVENFLMKSGLCLLDIYSEWCGPCQGMVSALRKIKLEIAGDTLNLAVAKAEAISHFKRFERKSEPTWMFIVDQMAVNIAFGSDQPSLTKLILEELHLLHGKARKTYALNELQPLEIERNRAEFEAQAEAEARAAQEAAENRRNYLMFVTDMIMENLPDCAVTLFGPHIPRDVVKKVIEMAESMQIHNKDRKYVTITKEEFDTINFECKNPLPEDVQELYAEEEGLACYWKLPEANFKLLQQYASELTKPHIEKDENGEPIKKKALIKAATVKVQYILASDEIYEEPPEPEPEPPDDIDVPPPPQEAVQETAAADVEQELDGEEGEEEEGMEFPDLPPPPPPLDFDIGFGLGLDDIDEAEEEVEEEDYVRLGTKYVKVPAIWIPNNHRTHAALIYVLFHSQTTPFLPPDPQPDPPHIIMAFDAWRRKQLLDVVHRNADKIPVYGFFTSDDIVDAEFIARSPEKYDISTKSPDDKFVLRVNKVTSHMMLSLATYNPTYVSPSVEIGAEEAKVFFPENYKTASKEALEIVEETKRLKKEKKLKKGLDEKDIDTEPDVDDDEVGFMEEADEDEFGEAVEYGDDGEMIDNYGEYPAGDYATEAAEVHEAKDAAEREDELLDMADEGAGGDSAEADQDGEDVADGSEAHEDSHYETDHQPSEHDISKPKPSEESKSKLDTESKAKEDDDESKRRDTESKGRDSTKPRDTESKGRESSKEPAPH